MRIAYVYPAVITSDPNLTPALFEPLGLLYIISYAEVHGFKNYQVFIPKIDESLNNMVERILEFEPDLLAFSVMTYKDFYSTLENITFWG